MDTTRPLEQLTEWGEPDEKIPTNPKAYIGETHYESVTYLKWCILEARRMGGRVKKKLVTHTRTDPDTHETTTQRVTVIAVFA